MVWMMGVWQLGEYGLNYDQTNAQLLQIYSQDLPGWTMPDVIGSPYAVVNYTCNVELGSDEDIANLKQKLNSLGLLLMLDFVPNHSAIDSTYLTENETSFYVQAPKGSGPPYDSNSYLPSGIAYGSACGSSCGGWQDTAQFNYWNPSFWTPRLNELLHVASLSDAIRCDMAYLELNDLFEENWGEQMQSWGWTRPAQEWWEFAITSVKSKYPDIIFLAEVYEPWIPQTQAVGFDYTYDRQLYANLGNYGDLPDIQGWISSNSADFIQHSAHFTSNHDEERAVTFFGTWWRADAAALVTYTLPGLRFFWMWDFDGYSSQIQIQLRREQDQPVNADVYGFYQTLWKIVNTPVFKQGDWTLLPNVGALMAWRWDYQDERRACVLNYSPNTAEGFIVLADAQPINGNDTIAVTDLLSGTVYWRSAQQMRTQGLFVEVNSWYGQIFQY